MGAGLPVLRSLGHTPCRRPTPRWRGAPPGPARGPAPARARTAIVSVSATVLDDRARMAYRSEQAWSRPAGSGRAHDVTWERTMPYRINHIHLKSPDPKKTADWYVKAFNFKIVGDTTRDFGDRFIRCQSEDGGMAVNISGARTGETLGPGDANPHHGLEHFGLDTDDIDAEIARLEGLGATRLDGPIQMPNGGKIAFIKAPDDVRLELIQAPK